jgi:hypothetical protein
MLTLHPLQVLQSLEQQVMLAPRHSQEVVELLEERGSDLAVEVGEVLLVQRLTVTPVLHQHLQQVEQQELPQQVVLRGEQAG